jgi:uncharacterized protein YkwD
MFAPMHARMRDSRYGRAPNEAARECFRTLTLPLVSLQTDIVTTREECKTMQRRKRIRLLIAAATIAMAVLVGAACTGPAPGPASAAAVDIRFGQNYLRGMYGRGPLNFDSYLEANAQVHANRLADGATSCGNLWHSGEMAQWYGGYAWGENVACVPGCPDKGTQVLDLWWNSPGHQANVLNPAFGLQGIGVTCNGRVEMVVAHYRSP